MYGVYHALPCSHIVSLVLKAQGSVNTKGNCNLSSAFVLFGESQSSWIGWVMGIHTGLTPPWANIVESINEIIRIRICSTATSTVTNDCIKWINWLMKGWPLLAGLLKVVVRNRPIGIKVFNQAMTKPTHEIGQWTESNPWTKANLWPFLRLQMRSGKSLMKTVWESVL